MTFSDSEIQRAAEKMVAELGEKAEQEVKAHGARAKSQGLVVTASVWERILGAIEKLRDEYQRRDLRKAS